MKRNSILGTMVIGLCFVASTSWATHDTSKFVYDVYKDSILNPEVFDNNISPYTSNEPFRSCLERLWAVYGPIAKQHLDSCWGITDPSMKKMCMDGAPPQAHVGDWVASMTMKLDGMSWCNTSAGQSACLGKRMVGPVFWENSVRPYFPQWRQYLTCPP